MNNNYYIYNSTISIWFKIYMNWASLVEELSVESKELLHYGVIFDDVEKCDHDQ